MKQMCFLILLLSLLLSTQSSAQWTGPSEDRGFLCNPPVFVPNEPDFPLTGLGVLMPKAGEIVPDVDIGTLSADRFNVNGNNAQPGLDVEINWLRIGALRGFQGGWAAGISIPWFRNKSVGTIGGQPAFGVAEGLGNIALGAKKILWEDCKTARRLIFGAAVELPTGVDADTFGPNNIVTNGYFTGNTQRMPLGWQPSSGTWNGLLALSYGRSWNRVAWQALLAGKIYGTDGQDVKIGNILIAEADGTYGISRSLAGSLGLALRAQADDSYPYSPLPVNGPALAGTTSHSSILYLDVGLRYSIMHTVTVGVAIRTPIVHPDAGMDPTSAVSVIFYPNF